MNPIKNVTDPHSISATDIPSKSDANPAGVISGALLYGDAEGGTGTTDAGPPSGRARWPGSGFLRRLKTRADSSHRTRDCWSWCSLLVMIPLFLSFFLRQNYTTWEKDLILNLIWWERGRLNGRFRNRKTLNGFAVFCVLTEKGIGVGVASKELVCVRFERRRK